LPGLFSPDIQIALLERLFHRDLSNPDHRTNVHLHHVITYPSVPSNARSSCPGVLEGSFFLQDNATAFPPKDPTVHGPITVANFLEKKLRWMTLGGQYDWTSKMYPSELPPPFPPDMKQLLKELFPDVDAQAAIVNLYSPGDALSVHRDVSEYCDQGLISISIGCDGMFVIGNDDGTKTATIRLRSGDAVLMTGPSRYAWHGVPRILSGTCPIWLCDWPAMGEVEPHLRGWRGWMSRKRININVRQMKEDS
jgi:DNA alkylation damage repair protein AlkB